MLAPIRVLFVCLGNICRSPAGENVLRHLAAQRGLAERLEIDSAGTAGWHAGKAPDARMVAAAKDRGITMLGRARQARVRDFAEWDYLFAMDRSNLADLRKLQAQCPGARAKLLLFCELCEVHDEEEVPDPYYGGRDGFDRVLDLLEDGCGAFLDRLEEGSLP
jgi:protein-tyrosine phosphatase